MAAATVCISLTDGAERFSRSCSMLSSTGSSSPSRNEARTAVTRGPLLSGARHVIKKVVQQLDRRILRVTRSRPVRRAA